MNLEDKHQAMRDQIAAAITALEVGAVVDPDASAQQAVILLLGTLQFRIADMMSGAVVGPDGEADAHEVRALYARGWEDMFTSCAADFQLTTANEAGMLSVMLDAMHAAVHTNATREQNSYAKAATFAIEAAAALLYLAGTAPADVETAMSRHGATVNVADRLNRASAMFARAVNGGE